MSQADDLEPYPLGAPVKPAPEPVQEWVPVDPATPWIQRSLVTGRWRNIRPPPPPAQFPWFGMP